ncbi:MAG: hypothetical protein GY820_31160 [Gammaproteobacteria bacterium]|nr:hypothetical protein [Gammaproteobacteria bacterium]
MNMEVVDREKFCPFAETKYDFCAETGTAPVMFNEETVSYSESSKILIPCDLALTSKSATLNQEFLSSAC